MPTLSRDVYLQSSSWNAVGISNLTFFGSDNTFSLAEASASKAKENTFSVAPASSSRAKENKESSIGPKSSYQKSNPSKAFKSSQGSKFGQDLSLARGGCSSLLQSLTDRDEFKSSYSRGIDKALFDDTSPFTEALLVVSFRLYGGCSVVRSISSRRFRVLS